MTILIAYATIEGQTGKIARFIDDTLTTAGHRTRLVDAGDKRAEVSFDGVDRVILAASVHERKHPKTFEVFVAANASALNARPVLLVSVSLSAAFPEGHEEAEDYATEMCMRTGLEPDQTALVAGAVRTGKYDYYATQVLRHVVLRDREFDPSAEEHEFTDWGELKKTVAGFLAPAGVS